MCLTAAIGNNLSWQPNHLNSKRQERLSRDIEKEAKGLPKTREASRCRYPCHPCRPANSIEKESFDLLTHFMSLSVTGTCLLSFALPLRNPKPETRVSFGECHGSLLNQFSGRTKFDSVGSVCFQT